MESLKIILILLVTVVILALYTMNTAVWPYQRGFQSIEAREQINNDEKKPCQILSEQYEFIGRTFRHEMMEFFLFVNNTYIHNVTIHRNVYKSIVNRLLEITNGFSNPHISKFTKKPDTERNLTMRGENVLKEFRCL